MRIYLMARYGRRHEMLAVAADLQRLGHEVTSRWIRGAHEYLASLDGARMLAGHVRPDWVVMGCESGSGRRLPKCEACEGDGWIGTNKWRYFCPTCDGTGYAAREWARSVRDACQAAGVPFYLKQLPDALDRVKLHPLLDGRQHLDVPWRTF